MSRLPRLVLASIALLSCAGEPPAGLATTERRGGPRVKWDVFAKPLPDIPLPNDAATRLDASSPTGRRLNVSVSATTRFEQRMRAKFDRLDGFGTYGPIMVQFTRPLDVKALWARHNGGPWPQGGVHRDDFRDDAVFVLNVDPRCKRFGEEVAVDVGRGRFPVIHDRHSTFIPDKEAPGGQRLDEGGNIGFENDPLGHLNNLMFEERDEDLNHNGQLDAGEDTDFDGHLDRPNFMEPGACASLTPGSTDYDRCVADQLLTFYDREDDTLILRPVWPLEERCTYAVVLTKRLVGEDGLPVESPFEGTNHTSQTVALAPLADLLPRYGLTTADVAFAWTYTTGSMTADLRRLESGLRGTGPFARLASEFPVESLRFEKLYDTASNGTSMEPGGCAALTMTTVWSVVIDEWDPNMCAIEAEYASIGGLFWGSYRAPNLMVDKNGTKTGAYDGDDDESWDLDPERGTATYGTSKVTFWCAVPKALDTSCSSGNPEGRPFCAPFPVIVYAHGYTGSRVGMQDFMGRTTAMGFAACAIDAYGHGKNRVLDDGQSAAQYEGFLSVFGTENIRDMLIVGRDRDLNNDGLADPGGDFWTADLFHTRDMVRQSALEQMQFARILRSLDGRSDGRGGVLGDANGDGKPELGGPQNAISMWGISLGGIVAGVAKGAVTDYDAVSPNAGSAGLTDVGVRSRQAGVPEAVLLPIMGPFIFGQVATDDHQRPKPLGDTELWVRPNDVGESRKLTLGTIRGVHPGDRVELHNLDKNLTATVVVNARGSFRVAVPADALGPIERRPLLELVGAQVGPVEAKDVTKLGDRLKLVFYEGQSTSVRLVVENFPQALTFQGTTYPKGAPLVALQDGLGYGRNSPKLRRFIGIAQHALDPADPAIWSAVIHEDHPNRSLVMPTAGDMNVPVNTAISEGRITGALGSWRRDPSIGAEWGWRKLFEPDPRYGHSQDHELVSRYVYESIERLERYRTTHPTLPYAKVLYDIDDLSDGASSWSCINGRGSGKDDEWDSFDCAPELSKKPGKEHFFPVPNGGPGKGLRATIQHADGTHDAMRIPMLRPQGQHGIYNAQPFRTFDMDAWAVNYTLRFLGTRGRSANDVAGCDCSTPAVSKWSLAGSATFPGLGRECTPADLNVCSPECAAAWGLRLSSDVVSCQ